MPHKIYRLVLIACVLLLTVRQASASSLSQTPEPDGPFYVVQEGDSLWDIAARFRVSMSDLAGLNGMADPGALVVGQRLVIPGMQGVQGELTTRPVGLGEDLKGISRRYQIASDILIRLNHITSPAELYAGSTLVLPQQNVGAGATRRVMLAPGQSLLELAILEGDSPWSLINENALDGAWSALPGDVLHLAGESAASAEENEPLALPGAVISVTLKTDQLVQGKADVIELAATQALTLSGELDGRKLHFFPDESGKYTSLQGVHAMTDPGLYPVTITGTLSSTQAPFQFSQSVLVASGDYPFDPPLTVSPETIDPAVTGPEDAEWAALMQTATPEKLWKGIFASPVAPPFSDCWPSRYGNRRAYNGGDYTAFHTGLDFCGGVGTPILAPAGGRVVFTGPLTVRGNATVIDHGWGVYSAYLHQSKILVKVGDMVEQGEQIGEVGGTGRVTGPHLHWEIWAGGVQVDPMDWLESAFP